MLLASETIKRDRISLIGKSIELDNKKVDLLAEKLNVVAERAVIQDQNINQVLGFPIHISSDDSNPRLMIEHSL